MKKAKIIIILLICVSLICGCCISNTKKSLDPQKLSGDILITNNVNDQQGDGLLLIDPRTKKIENILTEYEFRLAEFSSNKEKILSVLSYNEYLKDYEEAFYEFDTSTNQIIETYAGPIGIGDVRLMRYVPGDMAFTYLQYWKLWHHNKLLDTSNILFDECDGYSWGADDETIVLSASIEKPINSLYIFSPVSKETTLLSLEGYDPEYSPNHKYIAYLVSGELDTIIKIEETKTKRQWSFSYRGIIKYMRFSPDGEYLAIVLTQEKKFGNGALRDGPLIIWDFKNDAQCTIVDKYNGESLDWK